jgi:membrane fusion protein, multidrug efflux system
MQRNDVSSLFRRGLSGTAGTIKNTAALLLVTLIAGCNGHADSQTGNTRNTRTNKAIPVVISTATLQTVPLTINAVGSLVAMNSAVVRTRVDGDLLKVEFNEGDTVTARQVLFRLDARPYAALLAEANANLAKDEATLARNHAQRQRYDDLKAKDYVSADDYAQIKANEQTAAAAVIADQASVQAAQLNLDYCTIRAPISGRTGTVAIRAGNLVKASDAATLVTITQLDPLYADFAIPQQSLDAVRQAMQAKLATVTLATGASDSNYAHASKLDFIDNTVDANSGTVHVRATVNNADHALWPAQFVHVQLLLEQTQAVITVPATAIGNGPKGTYVFVIDDQQQAHQRAVTVLRQTAESAVITQGVAVGEQVVSDGQSRLQDGAHVQVAAQAGPPVRS